MAQKRVLVFVTRSGGFPTSSFVKGSRRRWSMALRAVLLAHSSLNAFCSEIHFGLPITFSVLQYLVGSAQLCLLRRCHSVYVSCQCFTDSVVSTPLSNFVPICWHLDIHVRVERMGIRRQFCFKARAPCAARLRAPLSLLRSMPVVQAPQASPHLEKIKE